MMGRHLDGEDRELFAEALERAADAFADLNNHAERLVKQAGSEDDAASVASAQLRFSAAVSEIVTIALGHHIGPAMIHGVEDDTTDSDDPKH